MGAILFSNANQQAILHIIQHLMQMQAHLMHARILQLEAIIHEVASLDISTTDHIM